ncbi:MAG: hypothetical protein UY04_C0027G0007 [Parcubacteria group bacterium GW2011_GWA2_47_7]|nr:MAG: hypothetical protein UY04_C0027G0007 [Parcubacteria group bacterium GW2011_GWA2_47_7]
MIGLALTEEQFKTLLRMVYIANTVVNGHRDVDFEVAYDELEQYVFSRAKDAGYPAATSRHEMLGEEHHHPSRIFENDPEVNMLMDQYDAHVMLELLAEKLAERDIEISNGKDAKTKMSAEDYAILLEERADKYDKVFSITGLAGVVVPGIT